MNNSPYSDNPYHNPWNEVTLTNGTPEGRHINGSSEDAEPLPVDWSSDLPLLSADGSIGSENNLIEPETVNRSNEINVPREYEINDGIKSSNRLYENDDGINLGSAEPKKIHEVRVLTMQKKMIYQDGSGEKENENCKAPDGHKISQYKQTKT
ncbi:hypothetical protein BDQ17DRAFT_1413905 [Cyathus striatus]|nr:hypothetical protein BDQ17DRAFT_1413905 [Cyathus striatus]